MGGGENISRLLTVSGTKSNKQNDTGTSASVAMALAFLSSRVQGSLAGAAEESSVGAACLDWVGLGTVTEGPPWVWAVGTVNTAETPMSQGETTPRHSGRMEPQGLLWPRGSPPCRGHHHASFSHTRWSLPRSWQAGRLLSQLANTYRLEFAGREWIWGRAGWQSALSLRGQLYWADGERGAVRPCVGSTAG